MVRKMDTKRRMDTSMPAIKKLTIAIYILVILCLTIPFAHAATTTNLANGLASWSQDGTDTLPLLPSNHIVRYNISTLPVHASSTRWITAMNTFGSSIHLGTFLTKHINYVGTDAPKYTFLFDGNRAYSDAGSLFAWPSDTIYEPTVDMQAYVYDRDNGIGYEFSYVNDANHPGSLYPNGSHVARYGQRIDYSNLTIHRPFWQPGGTVSGLPVIPMILSRADMESDSPIGHALEISYCTSNGAYIWPASSSTTVGTNSSFPPFGARFRLKSSFSTSGYNSNATKVLKALKSYGGILHIRSGDNTTKIIGESGVLSSTDKAQLAKVALTDLEFVDESSLMISPTSYATRQLSGGTVTPAPTPASTPAPAPTTTITVTSPNGGESWQRGTSHTLTWSYTGNPGSTVKIVLLKAGTEVGTITSSTPIGSSGKGSCTWLISSDGLTGSDFRVSVQSTSLPAIKDTSNNYFTITSRASTPTPTPTPTPAPAPTITVTSPNGGESWQRGTTHTVSWTYTGSPGSTVKIVLLKAGTEVGTITSSTPIGSSGKGSYSWPISTTGLTGNDFSVSVQSTSLSTIRDSGNNYFTITSGSSTPAAILLAPTTDERMMVSVYQQNTGVWKIDVDGDGIWDGPSSDTTFQFGKAGDIPLAGDWNGDGKQGIVVFRPSTGYWYLNYHPTGTVDKAFPFGTSGDIAVAGAWT